MMKLILSLAVAALLLAGPAQAGPDTPDTFVLKAKQGPALTLTEKPMLPWYPLSAREMGREGRVVVDFVIDTEGNVRAPQVVSSTGGDFSRAALAAIATWHFQPVMHNGMAEVTRVRLPIRYDLVAPGSLQRTPQVSAQRIVASNN